MVSSVGRAARFRRIFSVVATSALVVSGAVGPLSNASAAAPVPFACDSSLYQVSALTSGLYKFTASSNSFSRIGTGSASNINATGYNVSDNFIYGVSGTSLWQIDAAGVFVNKGSISGTTPATSAGEFYGSVLLTAGTTSNNWTSINVSTRVSSAFTLTNGTIGRASGTTWAAYDFAVVGNYAYGLNNQTVYVVDLATKTAASRSVTGPTTGSYGAAYADADGNVYFYNNTDNKMFKLSATERAKVTGSATTPVATLVGGAATTPALTAPNDGANCPNAASPFDPTLVADTATTPRNTAVTVDVLANDTAVIGTFDTATLTVSGAPSHGSATIVTGKVRYTPTTGYTGSDSLTYEVCNTAGGCATATLSLTVTVPNAAPVANTDTVTAATYVVKVIDVLANDTDADGDTLTITSVGTPSHGTASIVSGKVDYRSTSGYHGSDSFTYAISDGKGGTATGTVNVTVSNTAPVAVDDTSSTTNGTLVTIDVLDNDTDANGDTLSISSVGSASHGTTSIYSGRIRYTPTSGYKGSDSFTYNISDGHSGTDSGTVTVSVANATPVAANDSATTPGGTAIDVNVLANDTDPNSDSLTITNLSTPSHGTASVVSGKVRYTPTAGYRGTDTFTYKASDGTATSSTATVTMTVENTPPVAVTDTASTHSSVTINVLANDTDANSDTLTISSVTQGAHGSTSIVSGQIHYTADVGYAGADSFTYEISDGHGGTATGTVNVTVTNAAPVAVADSTSLAHGPSASVTYDVVANDTDSDSDTLSLASVTGASHGSASLAGGQVLYTPTSGYVGDEVLSYSVSDGRTSSDGTFTVHVTNDGPVANADSLSTATNTDATVNVVGNDTDSNSDSLTVSAVGSAGHGTIVDNADGTLTYTPTTGYRGSDSFTYEISDGHSGTASSTVSVTVLNAAPTANSDVVATASDTAVTLDVLANDTDPNSDSLTVDSLTQGTHGTVVNDGGGSVTYTPNSGYKGSDSFDYTISDGAGGTSSSTVEITVANAGPTGNADSASTLHENGVQIDVLANDTDPNGDTLAVLSIGAPGHGTAVDLLGQIYYTPDPGFVGSDSFSYTITDFDDGVATATVSVEVTNAAPVAVDDSASTSYETAVTVAVLDNDTDANGDPLEVSSVGAALHGSSAVNSNGTVTYTPDAAFHGSDSFTYTISDGFGGTSSATVSVTVDAPLPPTPPVPSITAEVTSICTNNAPYVTYLVDVTNLAAGRSATSPAYLAVAHIVWKDSAAHTVATFTGQALAGTLLWPGAAVDGSGHGSAWPGWILDANGVWVPGDDGFGASVTGSTLTFSVGDLTTTVPVTYPTGGAGCVPAPALHTGNDSVTVTSGSGVTIVVLGNDSGVDAGARITISGQPGHGSVVVNADGTITYTADAGFAGIDSFTYSVRNTDGTVSSSTVSITVAGTTPLSPPATGEHPRTGANLGAILWAGMVLILMGIGFRYLGRRPGRTGAA